MASPLRQSLTNTMHTLHVHGDWIQALCMPLGHVRYDASVRARSCEHQATHVKNYTQASEHRSIHKASVLCEQGRFA